MAMDKPLSFFAAALKVLIKDVEQTRRSLRKLQTQTVVLQKHVRPSKKKGAKELRG
jgi:hypothetical protein